MHHHWHCRIGGSNEPFMPHNVGSQVITSHVTQRNECSPAEADSVHICFSLVTLSSFPTEMRQEVLVDAKNS
jgi:hypothetical protein